MVSGNPIFDDRDNGVKGDMRSDEREYDDPALQTALHRVCGDEAAPPALRSRVRALLADGTVADGTSAPRAASSLRSWWARWQSPVYASIAAAAVVLGIGVLVLEYTGALDSFRQPAPPARQVAELPRSFGSAMVTVHNRCAGMSDHHLAAPAAGNDLNAVQLALAAKTTFPVLATSPGEGWTFKGAGQCLVGGTKSVHLVFARGSARVSVFSLPAAVAAEPGCAMTEGIYYQSMVDGLPIAGFRHDGGLHCVVGSGPAGAATAAPSLDEIVTMRDRLAMTCGAHSCAGDLLPAIQTASFTP